MKATLLSSTLAALALVSGSANAQSFSPGQPAVSPPFAYHHASTLEEGVLRGGADLLRGIGEMNYNNSLAMINGQEAYSRALDNRLKGAATYFDVQTLNREARAEKRGQRATEADLARLAKARAPERLAAIHFDVATKTLVWPEIFNHPYFAEERAEIDRLMSIRGGAGPESREIQMLAAQMTDKLQRIVHNVNKGEYAAAKRFVTSLQYEMNYAPGAAAVASTW
jgi:hypothetical protein